MEERKEISIGGLELQITKATLDKVIAALPEGNLTAGIIKIARNALDQILRENVEVAPIRD